MRKILRYIDTWISIRETKQQIKEAKANYEAYSWEVGAMKNDSKDLIYQCRKWKAILKIREVQLKMYQER